MTVCRLGNGNGFSQPRPGTTGLRCAARFAGKGGEEMQCVRCNGLMVFDRFADLADDTGQIEFGGWRCLVCGNIADPVIVANRQHPPVARKPLRKRAVAA